MAKSEDERQNLVREYLENPNLAEIKLYTRNTLPKNRSELIEVFLDIWDSLELKLFEKLSDSMPERLERVIEYKGGWIYFFC